MPIIQSIFTAFGGVTPLARAIGEPVSTVHSWKDAKAGIPRWHRQAVLNAATVLGKELSDDAILYLTSREKAAA